MLFYGNSCSVRGDADLRPAARAAGLGVLPGAAVAQGDLHRDARDGVHVQHPGRSRRSVTSHRPAPALPPAAAVGAGAAGTAAGERPPDRQVRPLQPPQRPPRSPPPPPPPPGTNFIKAFDPRFVAGVVCKKNNNFVAMNSSNCHYFKQGLAFVAVRLWFYEFIGTNINFCNIFFS